MELFMRNIDWTVTKRQVEDGIANILHGPTFSHISSTPLNFHVHLHPDRGRIKNHSGSGFLTLPRIDVGEHFLQVYGSTNSSQSITIGRKKIAFATSRRPNGRPDVVQAITLQPYVHPDIARERQRRQREIGAGDVSVNALQFGWECRDGHFSIECEEICEGRCAITFNKDRREIRINLRQDEEAYAVAIPYSSVNSITAHTYLDREHVVVFSLNTVPSYEKEPSQSRGVLETILGLYVGDVQTTRKRLSFLPIPDHERVAPYASLAIRVICPSNQDLREFRRLCSSAQLHRLYDYEYPVVRRDLFSSFALERLQTYLAQLNWCVAFQIESLVRKLVVDIREALRLMPDIIRIINSEGKEFATNVIRKFRDRVSVLFDPEDPQDTDILQTFRDIEQQVRQQATRALLQPSDGSLYQAFHVKITPTTFFLDGPFPERSNRVIRAYEERHQESFVRVSFVDEAGLQYRFDREIDGKGFIRARLGPFFFNGLKIAHRNFSFLAYSQSALKEHSVWFVKRFRDAEHGIIDAPTIIASLGNFDGLLFDERLMFCPARYAARISQSFTATDAVQVEVEEIFTDEDICTTDGKYQFTDGVGTLSKDLAREIWRQLKSSKRKRLRNDFPSAYQVRFQGSKGMLSIDHRLRGLEIHLRPSMIKFEAPATTQDIEIARAFDKPGAYFLNRPLIMLLEGLGVPFEVFKRYQDIAVAETRQAAGSLQEAANLMEKHGLGTSYRLSSILSNLEKLYIGSLPDDKFYEKMLEYAINHVLRVLKNYARIPIPGAWTLVGVADVHGYLLPNEIFACVKPINGGKRYLRGPILISRSPTIHPGDVMVVNAIGSPPVGSCFASEALPNTVVFSIRGERPVPSCLGGGDLDGDVYNLIPLEQLPEFRPTAGPQPPASYAPATKKMLDRPSTMNDVAEFVMEYISSDVVGIIAINWLIIADQSSIFDADCMKLASLHSDAVDYPKSGQPVAISQIPRLKSKQKPDWNAPETINAAASGDFYESTKSIGRLFREIDLPIEQQQFRPHPRRGARQEMRDRDRGIDDLEDTFRQFRLDDARVDRIFSVLEARVQEFIDTDIVANEEDTAFIAQLFSRYALELRATCIANSFSHARSAQLSEEEAIIGTIAQKSSQQRKRKDAMSKLRESTDVLVRGIREELAGDDNISSEASLERAWVAWEFAISQGEEYGAQSFKWVALGAIFEAIREIEGEGTQY